MGLIQQLVKSISPVIEDNGVELMLEQFYALLSTRLMDEKLLLKLSERFSEIDNDEKLLNFICHIWENSADRKVIIDELSASYHLDEKVVRHYIAKVTPFVYKEISQEAEKSAIPELLYLQRIFPEIIDLLPAWADLVIPIQILVNAESMPAPAIVETSFEDKAFQQLNMSSATVTSQTQTARVNVGSQTPINTSTSNHLSSNDSSNMRATEIESGKVDQQQNQQESEESSIKNSNQPFQNTIANNLATNKKTNPEHSTRLNLNNHSHSNNQAYIPNSASSSDNLGGQDLLIPSYRVPETNDNKGLLKVGIFVVVILVIGAITLSWSKSKLEEVTATTNHAESEEYVNSKKELDTTFDEPVEETKEVKKKKKKPKIVLNTETYIFTPDPPVQDDDDLFNELVVESNSNTSTNNGYVDSHPQTSSSNSEPSEVEPIDMETDAYLDVMP